MRGTIPDPAALPSPTESIWFATLSPAERDELQRLASGGTCLPKPDVLVVGGGLVGLALTYFLTERGARVQLIDAGPLAAGASGANLGGVWPNDQGIVHAEPFQALAFLGRDLWGRLSLRPGFAFDWRVNGLLGVNPDKFPPSAGDFASRAQSLGYAVQAVDAEQIAALEPRLRTGLASGVHFPSEAHVHPVKAALSLARASRRGGAVLTSGVRALGAEIASGRIAAVETSAGRIEPGKVVSATGWTADWLRDLLPVTPPLRPVSGQLISTDPQPPLLKAAVGGRFLVVQLKSGEIVTGANVVEGNSLQPDPQASSQFIAAARELIPALADVPFTRAWCGIRPGTPDGLPILDRVPEIENLWLNCGHYRNGVLLAPACGQLLSEWIVQGKPSLDLSAFSCTRFGAAT